MEERGGVGGGREEGEEGEGMMNQFTRHVGEQRMRDTSFIKGTCTIQQLKW